ncbi:MAG: hypothetical protein GYB35_05315 [Algicola sp.]|nr:hypothetical protein [Algicola sp.]
MKIIIKEDYIEVGPTSFWLDPDGILNCRFGNENPNYQLDTFISKLYIKAIDKLCKGKPVPILIDLRGAKGTFSKEAVQEFAQSALIKAVRISEAFVYDSFKMKLLILSYKRIYNQFTPYEIFIDIQLAQGYCLLKKNEFYGSN